MTLTAFLLPRAASSRQDSQLEINLPAILVTLGSEQALPPSHDPCAFACLQSGPSEDQTPTRARGSRSVVKPGCTGYCAVDIWPSAEAGVVRVRPVVRNEQLRVAQRDTAGTDLTVKGVLQRVFLMGAGPWRCRFWEEVAAAVGSAQFQADEMVDFPLPR